ncbi:Nuclear transcription factor Y subunit C-1 [Forsythia ovata]
MENNPHHTAAPSSQPAVYPPQPPYPQLLQQQQQQQQQQLQMFWTYQRQEIEQVNDFRNHQLPLARIKKIMKADEDVRMISAEAPILFAKACELFILELTIRSWLHAEENKRRTLQKNDIAAAITRTDIFDFLVDIVPRDEIKEEAGTLGAILGPPVVASGATGVPYYYSPMGQPMMGQPAVPGLDPGMYLQAPPPPPSQAWQSVWQTAPDDGSYASGGGTSSNQANLDGQE